MGNVCSLNNKMNELERMIRIRRFIGHATVKEQIYNKDISSKSETVLLTNEVYI